MSSTLTALIQQAKLKEALKVTAEHLKSAPTDLNVRSTYIELLCVDGELERADQQLELIVKQNPEYLPGVVNLRQLIKAAQARIDFSKGADTATLVSPAGQSLTPLIELRLAALANESETLVKAANKLEELRSHKEIKVNGVQASAVRDIDDTLAGYLEVFGANGQYYLVPLADIGYLKLLPPTSLCEQIWRKAEIDIVDGPQGEVFIPLTYLNSETGGQKLGKETDWVAVTGCEVYEGRGQKMLLVDDQAMPFTEIMELSKVVKQHRAPCAEEEIA